MTIVKQVTYQNLLDEDRKLQDILGIELKDEIEQYKKTCELYISLFNNAIRTYREEGKTDYIHLIAVKIFQDSRASFDLALKGQQPQTTCIIRGALEAIFLIYDFKFNPDNEDIWFNAGKGKREDLFKAGKVRNRLEGKMKTHEAGKVLYGLLSDFSSHANMESCLWYIETTAGRLFYHWAGRREGTRSIIMVLQAMFVLTQTLFVLVEEDIYTFTNSKWLDEYDEWKKTELEVNQRLGRLIGKDTLEGVVFKPSPRMHVNDPRK